MCCRFNLTLMIVACYTHAVFDIICYLQLGCDLRVLYVCGAVVCMFERQTCGSRSRGFDSTVM